jgi:nucleoside-diphosphate-sugar epimerase
MRLFVTGGTGFIGSHFLAAAMATGYEIRALRRPGSRPRLTLPGNPTWVEGALDDDWHHELAGCHALVHLAAAGVDQSENDWAELYQVNVLASLKLWQQAIDAGVPRLIICGSCFEYGASAERYEHIPVTADLQPMGPYAASKASASLAAIGLCRVTRVQTLVLRPFHVFGPGESEKRFWPMLRKAALAGEDVPMTAGDQVRDFVPVEKVAATFLHALIREDLVRGEPQIENVGTGQPQTLREFAEYWWKHCGAQGKLLPGAVPYRDREVMRYVPQLP